MKNLLWVIVGLLVIIAFGPAGVAIVAVFLAFYIFGNGMTWIWKAGSEIWNDPTRYGNEPWAKGKKK
ncbi:MAG: hypothetical protein ACLPVO_09415 [Desulfomonilaceae bacterium]